MKTKPIADKKIVLSCWLSPSPIEKLYKWYKQCGLNEMIVFPACEHEKSKEEIWQYLLDTLNLCRKYDIKAKVNVQDYLGKDINWVEKLKGYEDVIKGFHIYDEPNVSTMENEKLKSAFKYFLEAFPDKECEINLLPSYATSYQLDVLEDQNYEDYVKCYCKNYLENMPEGRHRLIGFDFYPLVSWEGEKKWKDSILLNYEIIANYAKKYGADAFGFIQASHCPIFIEPDYNQMMLQYGIALTYGTKDLRMYCYQTPGGKRHNPGRGSYDVCYYILKNGYDFPEKGYKRSSLFYKVKKIHAILDKMGKEYLQYSWKGVLYNYGSIHADEKRSFNQISRLENYEKAKIIGNTEKLIVGCFEKGDKDAYVLTNYSNPLDLKVSAIDIDFGNREKAVVYSGNKKRTVKLKNGHYITKLKAGAFQFVIPE